MGSQNAALLALIARVSSKRRGIKRGGIMVMRPVDRW